MKNEIRKRLQEAFKLTQDLCSSLNDLELEKQIPHVKSNKIGKQFWCILGARENYIKALNHSEWKGFSCSVQNRFSSEEFTLKSNQTEKELQKFFQDTKTLNNKQEALFFDLFTHEVQHHGQLIRFFYALEIPFPKSWNKKYTV